MGKKVDAKAALFSPVEDKRVILFMVVRGFGMFLTVSGMAGIALATGPLDKIIGFEPTPIFGNTLYAFLVAFLLTVIGGAIEFVGDAFIKHLSS